MYSVVASLAQSIGDLAEFVHRVDAPVDADGAYPVPALLKQDVQAVQEQVVKGRPFRLSDLPAYIDAAKNLNGIGINDRLFFLEKIIVLLSRLPTHSQFSRQLENYVIDILYKDLPHPPSSFLSVPTSISTNACIPPSSTSKTVPHPHYAARSADGSGYNPFAPFIGEAGSPYARTVPSTHAFSMKGLPDAGLVFDTLLKRPSLTSTSHPRTNGTDDTSPHHNNSTEDFFEHPGGLSSMFFAFADLIIHSCFNTDHGDWTINNASSYLDLSPLYGSCEDDVKKARRGDGTGRLWEDVWVDGRIGFMPPSVVALVVLFCRNHNYIADKILAINESGTYVDPLSFSPSSSKEAKQQLEAQGDEIFQRARLVNCGFFMQAILRDYVGAILGLIRDGSTWRLDPLSEIREVSHDISPRGQGNVVSIEFNLMYRWHAALSKSDTEWTEALFEQVFDGKPFSELTIKEFVRGAAKVVGSEPNIRERSFIGPSGKKLDRDPTTKRFKDADLADILHNATESPAGAFRARGVPEVLRVVEIMGIEQARNWGVCSLNEFRKFMGLKPYASFRDWNPNPSIHTAAKALYEHIDNLELHVGLQAEETKPPMPGAGLCPGYTISRAILADAVALTRGDRFLTTDFTVFNLTSWGYQYCQPDTSDGSFGGMLSRLLMTLLPDHYPADSAYSHFPMMVPRKMKTFLKDLNLKTNQVDMYTFHRPFSPVAEPVMVTTYDGVRDMLNKKKFASDYEAKMMIMSKGLKIDTELIDDILSSPGLLQQYGPAFFKITEDLIKEKTIEHNGHNGRFVDIVKDVINLVPVRFVASYLAAIPIKTVTSPRGAYPEKELSQLFADTCQFVYIDLDPVDTWRLQGRATVAEELIIFTKDKIKKLSDYLSLAAWQDVLVHLITGEEDLSHAFLSRVAVAGHKRGLRSNELAASVFVGVSSTTALYSKAITHVVDFFLNEGREGELKDFKMALNDLSGSVTEDKRQKVMGFVREALRLNPPTPIIKRTVRLGTDLKWKPGQVVYGSIVEANLDSAIFGPEPMKTKFDRDFNPPDRVDFGMNGLMNSKVFRYTAPHVLHAIFKLGEIQKQAGQSGQLDSFQQIDHGLPEIAYIGLKGEVTPWPASLIVRYDA